MFYSKFVSSKGFSLLVLISSLFFSACSAVSTDGQKKLGPDADYFIGLQLLNHKNEKEARLKFNSCIKKGTYYCARKSAEALTTFGDLQERNQAALYLYQNFPDSDSLLIAAKQFNQTDEIHKLIEITDNCDYSSEYNETIKYRLEAKQKRGDSDFNSQVFDWFTSRKLTETHYKFYRDTLVHPDFEQLSLFASNTSFQTDNLLQQSDLFTPQDFVINYRIKMFRRDYSYCLENAQIILDYFENQEIPLLPQLVSDIGKAYLYGSQKYAQNGAKFKQLAGKYKDTDLEYYFWFYAGRFYEKAGTYYNQSKKCFESAIQTAMDDNSKDDAIWYLLDTSLNYGISTIYELLEKYSSQWSNPYYFDDFFEKLVTSLFVSGQWNSFYKVYSEIDGFASDELTAQLAYIYGRLLQEGYADPMEGVSRQEAIFNAFDRTSQSGTALYYKILAAYQLNYDDSQIEALLCQNPVIFGKETFVLDKAAEKLLEGYAIFGFPEYIYQNYMELYKKGISCDLSLYLSEFLQKCGPENHDYYTQSLRIAARTFNYGDRPLTRQELKLVYPEDYAEYVTASSETYSLDTSIMFALIRSESFFDADVSSSAGAIGLCQLMEFTGADIAQRLRKSEYSLTDPETNIEFGCYYLNNLYSRCENSYLLSFFSYNAGITRVRKWLQSSLIEFGKKKNMPGDLFLETIPYAETREYGRKLVSASVMYEWLYKEEPPRIAFRNKIENLVY